MLLEVWCCAVEDWLVYVRRATKWKCHMPWCSSNSSSSRSSSRPVQYNLWFDICISFNLCTSMFCLGHDQATELCSKEDVKHPSPTLMSTI